MRQKLRNLVQSGAPAEIQREPDLLQKFEQRFPDGNLVIADLLKRDLVKLGYTTWQVSDYNSFCRYIYSLYIGAYAHIFA